MRPVKTRIKGHMDQQPWYMEPYSDETNWMINGLREGLYTIQWGYLLPPPRCDMICHNYQLDYFAKMTLTIVKTPQWYTHIPAILDMCPDENIYREIIQAYVLLAFRMYDVYDEVDAFRRTFYRFSCELRTAHQCQRADVRREFIKEVIRIFCAKQPSITPIQLCAWYFDPRMVVAESNHPDAYKLYADDICMVMRDALVSYFVSPEGRRCWASIKRLRCGGFICPQIEHVVDELLVNHLGLEPVQFERPDMDAIMRRCGWIPFDDDEVRAK